MAFKVQLPNKTFAGLSFGKPNIGRVVGGLVRKRSGTTLSNDTTLSTFTINGDAVVDGGTKNLANGTTSVTVVATPTHPSATVGTITGDTGLATGDNLLSFTVTAEDGVTTRDYTLNLHVLNLGTVEITEFEFSSADGGNWVTGGEGKYILVTRGSTRYALWGNTGGESEPTGVTADTFIQVTMNALDGSASVASSFSTAWPGGSPALSGSLLTSTESAAGAREDASAGTSPVAVTITQQGADPS